MAAVATFWSLPEEEALFLQYLAKTGSVFAIPSVWVKTREELTPQPIGEFISAHSPTQLEIGLEKFARIAPVKWNSIKSNDGLIHQGFGLNFMESCLIVYSRGHFRQGKLTQSNLAAYWTYPDLKLNQMIRKDAEFISWAKKVFRSVRAFTPESVDYIGFGYRATKGVKLAVDEGRLEVTA